MNYLQLHSWYQDSVMDDKHRNSLKENRVALMRDLEPLQLLSHLTDVLNDTDMEEIKARASRVKQSEWLLDILARRGEKAFDIFVNALQSVKGQTHLASLLTKQSGKLFS